MSEPQLFGALPDGRPVHRLTLRGGGLTANLLTLGATIQDLRLDGVDHPLVLGAPTLETYLGPMQVFGTIVGRFANRIANARFTLDGVEHQTDRNEKGRQTLHGGIDGTWRKLWTINDVGPDRATFSLSLPDGHMGFPGRLDISLVCALSGDGALDFEMRARSDAPTVCNLAHHGYFNLDGSADICDHLLEVAAEHYLPVDDDLIPTGEVRAVGGTPFDFRAARPVGNAGIDHNLCLSTKTLPVRRVATLTGPATGIAMDIETDAPGLQVYDGAHISDLPGLDGRVYGTRAGLALETQLWPDAPNQPAFPSAVLRPGDEYLHRVTYRFRTLV